MPALRHPLGFTCLPLLRGPVGICVHVWTAATTATRLTTSPFHCHSWELYSLVLDGAVHNQCLELADSTTDEAYRIFEIHSTAVVDEIRATADLVSVRTGEMWVNGTRDFYHLRSGVFHRTVVPGGEACTLVIGLSRPGGADRSLGPPDLGSHQRRRRYCDPAETVWLARGAARHLRNASGEGLVEQLSATAAGAYVTISAEGEM
ncbi:MULTISPECIES: hypothetical protein [unclassified Frankia]|uniref:hypothetical protein n=1 Tax=unclassified Frankia TaxID=2632575 RepID=UPI000FF8AB57|nr:MULTISPECIES: hypothetical protein [unclassified Frankia]